MTEIAKKKEKRRIKSHLEGEREATKGKIGVATVREEKKTRRSPGRGHMSFSKKEKREIMASLCQSTTTFRKVVIKPVNGLGQEGSTTSNILRSQIRENEGEKGRGIGATQDDNLLSLKVPQTCLTRRSEKPFGSRWENKSREREKTRRRTGGELTETNARLSFSKGAG